MFNSANYIHLRRLFQLRNLALIAQVIAITFTLSVLHIDLPTYKVSLIVLLISFFNFFVWLRLKQPKAITENELFIHLTIDVLALALLLYFTGGATNPFVMLFLFPLTVTVTILPVRYAWLLATITVVCYSLLMFYYQPLPIEHGGSHNMHMDNGASEYNLHLVGMWVAFILNAGLITYYVYGMGNTLRHQQKQLTTAREQSIRDEQLVILGTLAASTAHELGTPLGTMALLISEIEQELTNENASVHADINNMKQQINRCKSSLTDLAASVGASSNLFDNQQQSICQYIQNIITEIHETHANINLQFLCELDTSNRIYMDRTLSLSLINIIDNAIEASPDFVEIQINKESDFIEIIISDQGPGLSDEALDKIGQQPYSEKELGLGLGLYLAYAAIRRREGSIFQENCQPKGSKTTILLPLVK